jgi:integrase
MSPRALLNVKEVSVLLSVHPKTIYAWKGRGLLPFVTINGRLRFEREKLEGFIERRRARFLDPAAVLQEISLPLDGYDRLHLKGGTSAVSNLTRRWNYGFGSVYLRRTKEGKDRWAIDYQDRGRRVREIVRDAQTRGEALIALQKRIAESFAGRYHPVRGGEGMSFSRLADIYIEDYAKVKKRSWQTDYYYVEHSMKPFFGTMACSEIRSLDIERFVKRRLDDGVTKTTVNRGLQMLKRMFNLAIDWGYLAENPARKVRLFSEKDNLKERILTEDEELRLVDASPAYMKAIIFCALNTGMRRGEILNLRWDRVDFERRTIRVDRTKSGKPRCVGINTTLLELLRRRRMEEPRSELVFPSLRTGRAFVEIGKAFRRACKSASITGLRFHDLRHTFASRLIERGVDIVTVKELLGHSTITLTQRYTHSRDEQRRRAVERLDAPEASSILSRLWHAAADPGKKPPVSPYLSMN